MPDVQGAVEELSASRHLLHRGRLPCQNKPHRCSRHRGHLAQGQGVRRGGRPRNPARPSRRQRRESRAGGSAGTATADFNRPTRRFRPRRRRRRRTTRGCPACGPPGGGGGVEALRRCASAQRFAVSDHRPGRTLNGSQTPCWARPHRRHPAGAVHDLIRVLLQRRERVFHSPRPQYLRWRRCRWRRRPSSRSWRDAGASVSGSNIW